ncbi:MAG: methyltransferase domain-containing protein [Crocinitomicaceae bacterium]|nr:methyltransferase domain-containing protein [Crocinitomicaceae bacterium]
MEAEVQDLEKAQSHYLLAKIGKRVLRPGGKEMTKQLIENLEISSEDKIAEFAPGLGFTASFVIQKHPKSYVGIEADKDHVQNLRRKLTSTKETFIEFIQGDAESTGLADGSIDKLFGEAMLSMHANQRKSRIIKEASRIVKKGGLYAIHELELSLSESELKKEGTIQRDLAVVSNVNARPLTVAEWIELLENEGFKVKSINRRPLRVLEPSRILDDEGLLNTLRIAFNIIRMPKARKRIFEMRKTFKQHSKHLIAISIIAERV